MRLFVNSGLYPAYRARLDAIARDATTFAARTAAFLKDGFGAAHFPLPVIRGDPEAMFANGDDATAQGMWAAERGLKTRDPAAILLAQIEEHRAEVFYTLDPITFDSDFVSRLPGSVRRAAAWRAAPVPKNKSLARYDLILNNFPAILDQYRAAGLRAAYLAPAHDPLMDDLAANADRPVDVVFVGGFSRHHARRTELLRAVGAMGDARVVSLHLDRSRLTRLAATPLGSVGPLRRHRMPPEVARAAQPPLFGRDLHAALSRAKIVVNGAIDMAGEDRGNMRCWEAMGLGCALVSDAGRYPDGMTDGRTMRTYGTPGEAVKVIETLLSDDGQRESLATAGARMIRDRYAKERQWTAFRRAIE